MKREYREINLEKFVPEEEEKLTKTEKEHIKKQFYESTGITTKGQQKKKQFKWYYIPAACVVFGLCVAITPIRDTAFAKALKSIVGIGEHLGKTEEDTYVTHVDQVKQDKDITITLKDAIASDQQLRCSVLVTNKDKTKTKLKDVQMEDMKINDQEPEENRGYAVLGKENVKKGTIHFLSVNYQRQDIPVNPKISLKVRVKSKLYHFKFVLKNQRFKKATKTVSIDQEIKVKGQTIQLDDLIVTPIDQIITIKVLKKQQTKIKNEEILLSGTNQRGDKVYFEAFLDKFTGNEYLYGTRENDDQMTYELDEKDLTYTLKTEEGQKLMKQTARTTEEWEHEQQQMRWVLEEMLPTLQYFCNLEKLETAVLEEQEIEKKVPLLTQGDASRKAYQEAMLAYIRESRIALNTGKELPCMPDIRDFATACPDKSYKEQVMEEIRQEAESYGMTVEAYAANGYEPPKRGGR